MPIEQATEAVELLWVIMTMGALRTGLAIAYTVKKWTD